MLKFGNYCPRASISMGDMGTGALFIGMLTVDVVSRRVEQNLRSSRSSLDNLKKKALNCAKFGHSIHLRALVELKTGISGSCWALDLKMRR